MSVTVHKSGNVQGQTITQVKKCTGTDYSTGGWNLQGHTVSQVNGMYEQGQTISQGKRMLEILRISF